MTETVQALADGNRIRHESRSLIHRDSQGRTRREEAVQPAGAEAGDPRWIFINDPVAGAHWVINPQDKTARKMPMPKMEALPSFAALQRVGGDRTASPRTRTIERNVTIEQSVTIERNVESGAAEGGQRPDNHVFFRSVAAAPAIGITSPGELHEEDLGERTIEGVIAKGTRQTRTIKPGEIGNERAIEIVYEHWESPELGVTIESRRSDPRSGVTTYKLTNIQRTEPLPTMFEPPAGYDVVDMGATFERRLELHERR